MQPSFYDPRVALSPNGLPPDANPPRGAEPRAKLSQFPFVLRAAGEAADRVDLPGASAAPLDLLPGQLAACHTHLRCPFAHGAEVDGQRSGAVERSQGADAVTQAGEENRKLWPCRHSARSLQLRRRAESNSH